MVLLAILIAARWVNNVMTRLIIGVLGGFALGVDTLAKLPGHSTGLLLNAVTALIGSPVIICFILKRQKVQWSFV